MKFTCHPKTSNVELLNVIQRKVQLSSIFVVGGKTNVRETIKYLIRRWTF